MHADVMTRMKRDPKTATTAVAAEFSATAETLRNGKRRITVLRNGQPFDTRTTAAAYTVVNLQGWDHADDVAPRYSAKPLPVGRAIEYGRCVGTVPIWDTGAPCPSCGGATLAPHPLNPEEVGDYCEACGVAH